MEPLTLAFLVTLGAGLATGIGSLLAFLQRKPSKKFLAFMLGLSAGVMLYVSMIEIFQKAVKSLMEATGSYETGYIWATVGFFGGFIVISIIDYFIDHFYHPGHNHLETDSTLHEKDDIDIDDKTMMRTGLFLEA